MFPELTADEVDFVIAKVKEWDQAHASTATVEPGVARQSCSCTCCQ
jgi:hypothetical protein